MNFYNRSVFFQLNVFRNIFQIICTVSFLLLCFYATFTLLSEENKRTRVSTKKKTKIINCEYYLNFNKETITGIAIISCLEE